MLSFDHRHRTVGSPMAGRTFPRRSFIQRDGSPGDALLRFVAHPARDIEMCPAKREGGPGFVVEPCGQPPAGGVAAGAIGTIATALELAPVNVLVTARALGRSLEWNLSRASRRIERPVAVQASQNEVGAGKREAGLSVIERFQPLP